MNSLLIVGRFTDHAESVLAAIQQFTDMMLEGLPNLMFRRIHRVIPRLEGPVAVLTTGCEREIVTNDANIPLWHTSSLAGLVWKV